MKLKEQISKKLCFMIDLGGEEVGITGDQIDWKLIVKKHRKWGENGLLNRRVVLF